jgi:uncharacterized membrane protein YccC
MQTMAPPEDALTERLARLDERIVDVDRRVAGAAEDTNRQFKDVNRQFDEVNRRITEGKKRRTIGLTASKETSKNLRRALGRSKKALPRYKPPSPASASALP